MKLRIILVLTLFLCISSTPVFARHEHSFARSYLGICTCHRCAQKSSQVYLVDVRKSEEKSNFNNCTIHFLSEKITTEYYSDGTKRQYSSYSILDKNGNVLEKNLISVEHIIFNNNHYLLLGKNNPYSIYNQYGIYDTNVQLTSIREYTYMKGALPNRLIVKCNKKYGIINLQEKIIVPMKYKSIKKVEKDLFLTKLNGYWGLLDSNNNIIVKNEYNKIKKINKSYLLKKEGKYGLTNINGQILYDAEYDKIKPLGEYILIKKDKKYGILDAYGKAISKIKYKKVRLKRNVLEVKIDKEWTPFGLVANF